MLESVLVANRGEIARRVIASARRLGIRSVAVYSEADADLPFAREADEAVLIGPAPPAASYLNGAAVLAAARTTGATSVHPGYGFLAENADFAASVIDAGLTWIGPAPASIELMGDKISARNLMEAAGVPVAAGGMLGDYVPFGIGQALGLPAGGNSLDNTLRVVRVIPTEWVLVDLRIHAIERGFGHGLAHLWAEDGSLLATARNEPRRARR